MFKVFLFLFAIAFCADVRIVSGREARANDEVITEPAISDFISVDNAEVEGLHANGSGLELARADDCINGKWMRKCDVKKAVPCVDETQVCVCNPEFAETKPGVCKHCDCGEGINCTFIYAWGKNCICPEGYRQDGYTDKCQRECSEKQPCKNGGTCSLRRCNCLYGTSGDLCEKILDCSSCVNPMEVDCLFDEHAGRSYCECKNSSLYYDYGRDICIPCPCGNGWCSEEITYYSRKLKCGCYSGYKEFLGYCKECDCGPGGSCELDQNGDKICRCEEGYYEREGRCNRCSCGTGSFAKCEVTGNEKLCFCKPGYQFVLGHCEDINECETNNTCPSWTTCYNTWGSFDCRCPEGYVKELIYTAPTDTAEDVGYVCEDIDECKDRRNDCDYSIYAKCVNLPGSYKCECKPGYEPYNYKVPPQQTRCVSNSKSWGPAGIVILTTCALLFVSCCMHIFVRKRAARLN